MLGKKGRTIGAWLDFVEKQWVIRGILKIGMNKSRLVRIRICYGCGL